MCQSGLDLDLQGVSWKTLLTSRSDTIKKKKIIKASPVGVGCSVLPAAIETAT